MSKFVKGDKIRLPLEGAETFVVLKEKDDGLIVLSAGLTKRKFSVDEVELFEKVKPEETSIVVEVDKDRIHELLRTYFSEYDISPESVALATGKPVEKVYDHNDEVVEGDVWYSNGAADEFETSKPSNGVCRIRWIGDGNIEFEDVAYILENFKLVKPSPLREQEKQDADNGLRSDQPEEAGEETGETTSEEDEDSNSESISDSEENPENKLLTKWILQEQWAQNEYPANIVPDVRIMDGLVYYSYDEGVEAFDAVDKFLERHAPAGWERFDIQSDINQECKYDIVSRGGIIGKSLSFELFTEQEKSEFLFFREHISIKNDEDVNLVADENQERPGDQLDKLAAEQSGETDDKSFDPAKPPAPLAVEEA